MAWCSEKDWVSADLGSHKLLDSRSSLSLWHVRYSSLLIHSRKITERSFSPMSLLAPRRPVLHSESNSVLVSGARRPEKVGHLRLYTYIPRVRKPACVTYQAAKALNFSSPQLKNFCDQRQMDYVSEPAGKLRQQLLNIWIHLGSGMKVSYGQSRLIFHLLLCCQGPGHSLVFGNLMNLSTENAVAYNLCFWKLFTFR